MATLGTNKMTLLDLAIRTNNGKLMAIVEVLNKENQILDDAIWLPSNNMTFHKFSQRSFLPSGSERSINQGTDYTATKTRPLVEPCSLIEDKSAVDQELVDLADDGDQVRFDEDMGHLEGMSQTLANRLIYANSAGNPERINGLATRYNALALNNVHGNSGTGSDLSSIWIVQWGPNMVHMIYPKNTTAPAKGVGGLGIEMQNMGLQQVPDESSKYYFAYITQFKIRPGLVVKDERCVQRICNIETSGSTNIFDPDVLVRAMREMPQNGAGAVIYANKTILAQMDINVMDKTNVNYTSDNPFGRPVMTFRGVPVKQVDTIVNTETAVT